MLSFPELKSRVNTLFDTAESSVNLMNLDQEYITKSIRKIKDDFLSKELIVVVCGEMRRGKSSLMQAFLEEHALFPVDINTCTNVVSIVRYDETEKIEVVLEDRDEEGSVNYESLLIDRAEIDQYVTEYGNENNHKSVNCLNVSIPNEKLKAGFVFVDTPGLGSLNFQHSQITQSYLPHADILIFVGDCLSPLTETELDFIGNAYRSCTNIVFILTKTDIVSKETIDTLVADMKQKTSTVIGLGVDDIEVVPVSSLNKLKYIRSKKGVHLRNSNYEDLERVIWKKIYSNRGVILIHPYLFRLQNEIKEVRTTLEVLSSALDKDAASVDRLKGELLRKAEKRRALLEDGAKWKSELQFELSTLGIEQTATIQDELQEILVQLNTMLGDKVTKEQLSSITMEINSALTNLIGSVKNNITREINKINAKVSEDLGLLLENIDESLKKVRFNSKDEVSYYSQQKSLADQFINHGRTVAMNSLGAAAGSTVIGGLIGGIFGFLAGGPAGAYIGAKAMGAAWTTWGLAGGTTKGVFDAIANRKNLDLPIVRSALVNYVTRSVNGIKNSTNISVREITKLMQEDLAEQLKDQLAQLDMLVGQLQKDISLKASDIPGRKEKLNAQLQIIDGLGQDTRMLFNEILEKQV